MAHRKTTQYTKEFRDGVVRLVLNGDKTAAQISRELKVPKVARWASSGYRTPWMRARKPSRRTGSIRNS